MAAVGPFFPVPTGTHPRPMQPSRRLTSRCSNPSSRERSSGEKESGSSMACGRGHGCSHLHKRVRARTHHGMHLMTRRVRHTCVRGDLHAPGTFWHTEVHALTCAYAYRWPCTHTHVKTHTARVCTRTGVILHTHMHGGGTDTRSERHSPPGDPPSPPPSVPSPMPSALHSPW